MLTEDKAPQYNYLVNKQNVTFNDNILDSKLRSSEQNIIAYTYS